MAIQASYAAFLDEMSKVNRKVRTLFDARAREQGLTLARARLLFHLSNGDGSTQTALAQVLEVEQPTMGKLIDGLEKADLIERRPVEGDRRAKGIFLTTAGREQAGAVLQIVDDLRRQVMRGVDESDLTRATHTLRTMAANIEAAS